MGSFEGQGEVTQMSHFHKKARTGGPWACLWSVGTASRGPQFPQTTAQGLETLDLQASYS